MELSNGNVGYEILRWEDSVDRQRTRFRYVVYKLTPYKEKVLIGEKRTLEEAEAEARFYTKIAAKAWSTPVWITGP